MLDHPDKRRQHLVKGDEAEADRREGLARLAGQVETARARVESIDDGVARRIADSGIASATDAIEFLVAGATAIRRTWAEDPAPVESAPGLH